MTEQLTHRLVHNRRVPRIGWFALAMMSMHASAAERPLQNVIDEYVADGMRNNLALQGESATVQQAQAALDVARARYLPELSVNATYSWSHGGRSIDLPIGDLLNPVYSTLNQMLAAQGRPAEFPQVANESIPFLLPHEQDTRLVARQPLYAPAISAGVHAQQAMLGASEQQRVALARELKRDITVAYLNWLKARSAVEIVTSTRGLLAENSRVNESLFSNGKVTEDQPLRARAELLDVEQQLQQARNTQSQAQSYVNFLLNRALNTPLETSTLPAALTPTATDLAVLQQQALEQRPELKQLEKGVLAAQNQIEVAHAAAQPSLALGVDAGIQGADYGFDADHRFATASLILSWKFYAGGGLNAQVDGAKAQARRLATQRDAAQQQIALQVQQAIDQYHTAVDSLGTAEARAVAARSVFRIASRKRDEGVISQTEFLDARNALTAAELNLNLTRFSVLIEASELDYTTASGVIPLP
jgi:outer membrane protein